MRRMTQREYAETWSVNAKQHFADGDYEWLCDQLEKYRNVLEIGCGSGQSTLVLILRGHHVLSIDINDNALNKTKELIVNNDYDAEIVAGPSDFNEKDVWLLNADVVMHREMLTNTVKQLPIDVILLCNPGGNLDPNLRMPEVEILLQYGFTENEIKQRYMQNAIPLLHKFSMIDAAADVAIRCGKPLMVVDRGSKIQLKELLEQLSLDTGMRKINEVYRPIRTEPTGGITLGDIDADMENKQLYWGAGLYMK